MTHGRFANEPRPRTRAFAWATLATSLAAAGIALLDGRPAAADETAPPASAPVPNEAAAAAPPVLAPVPPHVEEAAVASAGSNYCFEGAHPVDPRVAGGVTWEPSPGRHLHPYPPIDLRLFALHDGCYAFVGDPRDFGYQGETYPYYDAHPVASVYGGGWCFMIGGHAHLWRPWSPYFVMAGSWAYWQGPYDPFFWSYWPYYAVFYRQHYPRFYGGGHFGNGWRGSTGVARRGSIVAPPVGRVLAPTAPAATAGLVRGAGWGDGRGFNRGAGWGRGAGWSDARSGFVGGSDRGATATPTPTLPRGGNFPNASGAPGDWSGRGGNGAWRAPAPRAPTRAPSWGGGGGGSTFRGAPASSVHFGGSSGGGWRRR